MQELLQIPGVSLEVYKQGRRVVPEDDGYLGQLWSGSAAILAVIDHEAYPTMSIFRDGKDHYTKQRDWLNNPKTEVQRKGRDMFLANRTVVAGTQVYGVSMPLHVDEERSFNTVHYPENMLMLAQWGRDESGQLTGEAMVWKVALVSQNGVFFVTVQKAYDVRAYENNKKKLCFPRFGGHIQLERLLVANAPQNLPRLPLSSFTPDPKPTVRGLKSNEGVVDRWYDARNMGCIITSHGAARVHWREVPERPRRRFLVEGERVQFANLREPPQNPETNWRQRRKARFQLQAYEVRPC